MGRQDYDDKKKASSSMITFNGQPKEFPAFKTILFTDLDVRTAEERQRAAMMAVQPGKADTVSYVIDLVDLLEGRVTRPDDPRPIRDTSTPALVEAYRIRQLEVINYDVATRN